MLRSAIESVKAKRQRVSESPVSDAHEVCRTEGGVAEGKLK